jgi:chemotaxis signal transduction protein
VIDTRHGVFGVGSHLVAVHTSALQEMFVLPEVHRPPGVPAHQRGVVSLRGTVLPAVDLRVCLGFVSAERELDELVRLLEAREQDHRNWLAELERSVAERRPFGLATDPRKCKFGQWYYAFKTEDPVLRGELARFEQPHATIHQLALQVESLKAADRIAEAHELVERTRTGLLAELVQLFQRTRDVLRAQHKEIGVCSRLGDRQVVLIVDRADAVTELEPFEAGADPIRDGVLRTELVSGLARWKGAPQPVLLLDLPKLAALA